jgi:hypothetical protein
MFSLSPRRYRQGIRDYRYVELCRYMVNGISCNDIICIESSNFCRSHYSRMNRVTLHSNEPYSRRREIPYINRNIINDNNIVINNMNSDVIIDINPIEETEDSEEEDNEVNAIINQLQNEKMKNIYIKNCSVCHNKLNGPLVYLECKCQFHLNCYLLFKESDTCINCDEKIYKTESELTDCSICLTKIKDSKIKLHCKHEFHNHCLSEWVINGVGNNTKNCPFCRSKIKLKID